MHHLKHNRNIAVVLQVAGFTSGNFFARNVPHNPSWPEQRSCPRRQVELLEQGPCFLVQSSIVQGVDPIKQGLEELVREVEPFWRFDDADGGVNHRFC